MKQEDIDSIRQVGDRLADYISANEAKGRFRDFCRAAGKGAELKRHLKKVAIDWLLNGEATSTPLLNTTEYVMLFDDDGYRASNARDLLFFSVMEGLHEREWLQGAGNDERDALLEEIAANDTVEEEE